MKWAVEFAVVAAVFLVLSASVASGASIEVIGDLNVTSKLGVGAASPTELLEVKSADSSAYMVVDRFTNQLGGVVFRENGNTQWIFPFIRGWQSDNLIVRDEPALLDVMVFQAGTGNVGIGTGTPGAKLDVNGWIRAKTGYGDSISIGGDTVSNDLEIQISAPAQRNRISLWNAQAQTGVDLGVRTVYAENLQITGSIATAPKTSYLSLPPHAFHLGVDCRVTEQWESHQYIYHEGLNECAARASVNLPHGSTVTKFTSYFYVNSDDEWGSAHLGRLDYQNYGNDTWMANSGVVEGRQNEMRVISDSTIQQAVVDNQNYGYYVRVYLTYGSPRLDVQFYGAVIEYTYTSP